MTHPLFAPDMKTDHPYWWEAAPRPDLPVPDLPKTVDVAIVGSGYTGLSAAITLLNEGRDVVIFDAEHAGWGCSTRNGGQIGTKLRRSLTDLASSYGRPKAINLIRETVNARDFIAGMIEGEGLDCDFEVAGRFTGAHKAADYEMLSKDIEPYNKELGIECHMVPRAEQHSEIGSDTYHGGQIMPQNATLHPGKFQSEMLRVVLAKGGKIAIHSPVIKIERDGDGFEVTSTAGRIRARDVIVATNGYTGAMFPEFRRRVVPVGSYVIATEPLPKETMTRLFPKKRATSDTRHVVHYYRASPDNTRIVWGGRVAAKETDCRASAPRLHAAMCHIFPELKDVKISHSWMGFVAFSFDQMPHIGLRDGLHYAMGYSGSGAAMAPYLGHKTALRVLGKESDARTAFDDVPFQTRPLYSGSPWFLGGAVLWYQFLDRVGR